MPSKPMVVYAWKANICDFRRVYSAEVIPYALTPKDLVRERNWPAEGRKSE